MPSTPVAESAGAGLPLWGQTLQAGFHLLMPFIDRVAYKHTLKEQALDVEEQICITSDNVQVGVDGVLYMQVLDARHASYGIGDYGFAISQLAQTTLCREIGRIELDKTFEERNQINLRVVEELDQATDPWGIKVPATKSRTSIHRRTWSPRWRSRCAPSGKSAPRCWPPKANATPRSTPALWDTHLSHVLDTHLSAEGGCPMSGIDSGRGWWAWLTSIFGRRESWRTTS